MKKRINLKKYGRQEQRHIDHHLYYKLAWERDSPDHQELMLKSNSNTIRIVIW